MQERQSHLRRKKQKRRRRTILFFLALIIAIGGYYVYNSYSSLMGIYNGFSREKSDLRKEEVKITSEPFSLLIMGIEDYATDGDNGRTDSLMFATVNPKTEQVSLMSIPRDTRVTIVGRDQKDKINAAHAYGGEKMAIETVENFLRVPVDHYVKIDFKGFKGVVDAVGGITVNVPFDFWERSDEDYYKKIYFKKGEQRLNGEEALAYVRMRKQDPNGDFGRAERQRQVVQAILHELNSASTVFKINDLAKTIGKNVKTDIPVSDGLALAKKFSDFDANAIETLTLEGEDQRINGIYYFTPDEVSVQTARQKFMENLGQAEPEESASSETTDATIEEERDSDSVRTTSTEWQMSH
ncbi:LytR family transcriptional regulator [Bacillus manliponensis]|uniref:LytR family transcriptional regulator n=1 Tax=Bacillus manliponensis TaxID=574376 RepID=A0A073K212_9BACI|nr:LCP family protein [Bacillus manliponensis]KEK21359.1 LytR family transcriptional regulator [Bacillus manliponensis]